MIIYKTTNLINGKIYIGQDRHNKINYLGSGNLIKAAVAKYGKENFIKEILEYCESLEELNERERYWIEKFNSLDKSIGYNIAIGGYNTVHSKETLEKISKAHKGKFVSEETKKKLSESHKGNTHTEATKKRLSEVNTGSNHPQYGIKKSEETIKRMSKPRSEEGKKNISEAHLGQVAWNKGKKVGPLSDEQKAKLSRKVYQYDLDCNFIAEFVSIKSAYDNTKFSGIADVCHGKRKSTKGFIFSFELLNKDYIEL